MPKPTHFERTVKLYITTVYNRDENHNRGASVPTNLLWQAFASCPPADRSAPSLTGGANVIIEISQHSNRLARGRLYRNRFDDLPSVGRPDETDGELQLGDNESLRTSAHFCWWDLGQTQGTAGNPAEHIGLLALEIAHTAPVASAIVSICAFATPDVGFDAEIEPFMFAEHWDHLQRHPHVHEIKIKVGAENPSCPTSVGDLVTAELGQAQKLELVYHAGRGESLDLSRWLKPLRKFIATLANNRQRREGASVTLPDGRTWDLASPHYGLKLRAKRMAGRSKRVDGTDLQRAIVDKIAELKPSLARQLNVNWD